MPEAIPASFFCTPFAPFNATVVHIERRGDRATANRWLEQAARLDPRNAQILLQAGMAEIRGQNFAAARKHLELAANLAPPASRRLGTTGGALYCNARPCYGHRALATGLVHYPDSPGLRLTYGRTLAAAGRPREAIAEFRASFVSVRPRPIRSSNSRRSFSDRTRSTKTWPNCSAPWTWSRSFRPPSLPCLLCDQHR